MRGFVIAAVVLLSALATAARAEELIALPDEEIPSLLAVSGFHSVEDKVNKLDVRLLEADGSADVAKNPVTLFVVVTDNAPADDSQTHAWRLPEGVSVVKRFTPGRNGADILALVDGQMNEKTGRFPEFDQVIHISYVFAKGVLSDKLKVSVSKP